MEKYESTKTPEILKNKTVNELLELLKETDKQNDQDICIVRGWIIDELELKMTEEEFDAWLDSELGLE